MKKLILCLSALSLTVISYAQWTSKTNLPSNSRMGSASFVINDIAYISGGRDANLTYRNECWAYDAQSDVWTQKASLPNTGLLLPGGFAINNIGYLICGWNSSSTGTTGLYKYDVTLNSWSTGVSMPAGGRYGPTSFVINNKAYVGLGFSPLYSDLWEFDSATNGWTQKASFPAGGREAFINFTLNGSGYVGTGLDQSGLNSGFTGLTDFYKYTPSTNTWTQVTSIPGNPRHSASCFVAGNYAYVGLGLNLNGSNSVYQNDFYKYDDVNDTWTQVPGFPSAGRQSTDAFSIGNCGYIFGGYTQGSAGNTFYNELWQYCISTGLDDNYSITDFSVVFDYDENQFIIKGIAKTNESSTFRIYDLTGKTILEQNFKTSPGIFETTIPALNMNTGIYMYSVSNKNNILQMGKVLILKTK